MLRATLHESVDRIERGDHKENSQHGSYRDGYAAPFSSVELEREKKRLT